MEWKGAKYQLSPLPQLKDFDEILALSKKLGLCLQGICMGLSGKELLSVRQQAESHGSYRPLLLCEDDVQGR